MDLTTFITPAWHVIHISIILMVRYTNRVRSVTFLDYDSLAVVYHNVISHNVTIYCKF